MSVLFVCSLFVMASRRVDSMLHRAVSVWKWLRIICFLTDSLGESMLDALVM